MMNIIEIDDAGWGSLIGGMVIGLLDVDNNQAWHGYITEVGFQQTITGRGKGWRIVLDRVLDIIKKGLHEFKADPNTHVLHMCEGWVLEYARLKLLLNEWAIKNTKIEGQLQEYVETAFQEELSKIDIKLASYSAPGSNTFFKHLEWVSENLSEREQYVKTGWKSWEKKWKPRILLKEHQTKTG